MIEVTTAYGLSFAFPAGDTAVGRCLRDHGEFGRIGATLAAQFSRGGTFIDVGANIGAFALPVSRSAKRVIAIEAQPQIAELLTRNVRDNQIQNIDVIAAAAGAVAGSTHFPTIALDATTNFGAVGLGAVANATASVPMVTLDGLAPGDTQFVKIDVEGYEPEVIAGASSLIHSGRPVWLIEVRERPETWDLIATFRRERYRTYWFYDVFVTPSAPKAPWAGKYLGDMHLLAISTDRPQPTQMPEAHEGGPWPSSRAGLDYLSAFGF